VDSTGYAGRATAPAAQRLTRAAQRVVAESHVATLLIVLAAFANTLLWARALPFDGGSDERLHLETVEFIARHGRLPVLGVDLFGRSISPYRAEITHAAEPPLPYLVAAAAMRLLSPWVDALPAARLASALSIAATVWLALRMGRLWFPDSPALQRCTGLFVAAIPQVTHVGSYVNSDAFTLFAASLALYLASRGVLDGWGARMPAALGGALGLALLSRLNGYAVVPAAALLVLLAQASSWRVRVQRLALTRAVAVLVSGWWFIWNLWVYNGDLFAARLTDQTWRQLASLWRSLADTGMPFVAMAGYLYFWARLFSSFWAVFGYSNVPLHPALYFLPMVLTLALVASSVWSIAHLGHAVLRRQALAPRVWLPAIYAGLLGSLVLATMWWCWKVDFQPLGRYLFPALLPSTILVFEGMRRALPQRHTVTVVLCVLGLMLLNWICLAGYVPRVRPGFFDVDL